MRALHWVLLSTAAAGCVYGPAPFSDDLEPGDVGGVAVALEAGAERPAAGAEVRLESDGAATNRRTVTMTNGRFRLRGLQEGRHQLLLTLDRDGDGVADDARRMSFQMVSRNGRRAAVDLGRVVLQQTSEIRGRVAAETLTGVRVAAVGSGEWAYPQPADGAFALRGITPGEEVVVAAGQGAVSAPVVAQVPPGALVDVGTLTLQTAGPGTLAVQVELQEDDGGPDLQGRGAQVLAELPDGSGSVPLTWTGQVASGALPAGVYRVRLSGVEGYAATTVAFASVPAGGSTSVVVRLYPETSRAPCAVDVDGDGLCAAEGTECDAVCAPGADGAFPALCNGKVDCDDDGDGQADVEERLGGGAGREPCRCSATGQLPGGPTCDGDPARADRDHNGVCDGFEPVGGQAATTLAWVDGVPASVPVGLPVAPLRVEVRDALGNRVPGVQGAVSLALVAPPDGVELAGTVTAPLRGGRAQWDTVAVGVLATGLTLRATTPGLPPADSGPFATVPGAPAALRLLGLPAAAKTGQPLSFTVWAQDALGNRVAAPGVTLSFSSTDSAAVLPPAQVLSTDTATVPLTFGAPGTHRVQVTSSGLTPAESPPVDVVETRCGDGERDAFANEACDDGDGQSDACAYGLMSCTVCTAACQEAAGSIRFCGDLLTDTADGEGCDDGANTDTQDGCMPDCRLPRCGDGAVHAVLLEQCDDGNTVNTDACTTACTEARCGDGFVQSGEDCDDGDEDNADACTQVCRAPFCGDGFVNGVESCDDGNADPADTCHNCEPTRCGDGIIQPPESCDDTNTVDTDGCTNDCRVPTCASVDLLPLARAQPDVLVTNLDDTGPGSLREALAGNAAVIGFAPGLSGGVILSGPLQVTRNVTVVGRPDLSVELTPVPGRDGPLLVDRGLLVVAAGVTLGLRDLRLRDGWRACGLGVVFEASGAAIDTAGTVQLLNVDLVNNTVFSDPVYCGGVSGGVVVRTGGALVAMDSVFRRNESFYRSDGGGGALYVAPGARADLCRVLMDSNRAHTYAGGAMVWGTLTADQTAWRGNYAYAGGALWVKPGASVDLSRSVVVGNSTQAEGGFAYVEVVRDGQGLITQQGQLRLREVTAIFNRALFGPVESGSSILQGAPFVDNTMAPLFVSQGYNVVSHLGPTPPAPVATDVVGTPAAPADPLVRSQVGTAWWQFFPTVGPGSPALGAGNPALAGQRDALGRVRDAQPDSGARESGPLLGPVTFTETQAWRVDATVTVARNGSPTTVVATGTIRPRDAPERTFRLAPQANADGVLSFRVGGLSPGDRVILTVTASGPHGTASSDASRRTPDYVEEP